MLTVTTVFIGIEMLLVDTPSFFWPVVLALVIRLAWVWVSGEWAVTPCQYGRCLDTRRKRKMGTAWVIVHGEDLLICNECYKFINSKRSTGQVIRQKNDF